MKPLDVLAAILPVVGGLGLALPGPLDLDPIATAAGPGAHFAAIAFAAVGAATLHHALGLRAIQRRRSVQPVRVS